MIDEDELREQRYEEIVKLRGLLREWGAFVKREQAARHIEPPLSATSLWARTLAIVTDFDELGGGKEQAR